MAAQLPHRHQWTNEQVDVACILKIFTDLSYPQIRDVLNGHEGMNVTTRVVRHKLQILAGAPEPSEQRRRTRIVQTDEVWSYWETASVRSQTIQHVLRQRGISDPPTWRSQVREDFLVVLMLYGRIDNAEIARVMNRKFPGNAYDARKVAADYRALENNEGSWMWWMTRSGDDARLAVILNECGLYESESESEDQSEE